MYVLQVFASVFVGLNVVSLLIQAILQFIVTSPLSPLSPDNPSHTHESSSTIAIYHTMAISAVIVSVGFGLATGGVFLHTRA